VLNLLRLGPGRIGWSIDAPLAVPPVCDLIARHGDVPAAEMWEVFNMGCGFVCVVPDASADEAIALLSARHQGAARIGTVTGTAGAVELPGLGLRGDAAGLKPAA
jgi:phosphoribosylformylglycinamidine cyclo-ligase